MNPPVLEGDLDEESDAVDAAMACVQLALPPSASCRAALREKFGFSADGSSLGPPAASHPTPMDVHAQPSQQSPTEGAGTDCGAEATASSGIGCGT